MFLEVGLLIISVIYLEAPICQDCFKGCKLIPTPTYFPGKEIEAYLGEVIHSKSHSWEVREPALEPGEYEKKKKEKTLESMFLEKVLANYSPRGQVQSTTCF